MVFQVIFGWTILIHTRSTHKTRTMISTLLTLLQHRSNNNIMRNVFPFTMMPFAMAVMLSVSSPILSIKYAVHAEPTLFYMYRGV